MAYCKINKTGCMERRGHPQIRFDMFLEPDDTRYKDTYIQVPVIPADGYPNKANKDGTPVDQKGYDLWYASLPRIWQLNPFHSHFIDYYPHDFTDSQLKSDMDFHLANFYKTYQDEWDKVQSGMRHGFAVEKRIIPVNYAKTLEVVEYKAIQTQVINRLNRLDEFKYTPIKLDDGKSYPATTIDIGDEAIDRPTSFYAGRTLITVNNPANDTGILDTVETWFNSNATGFKVGTFSGSGNSYDDRDYETIGAVTAGSKQTFSGLSIDVVTGDFIGCYFATGLIEISTGGGYTATYVAVGDKFGTGSATYSRQSDRAISLYATGDTGGYAGKLYGVSISKAFGAEVSKVNGV